MFSTVAFISMSHVHEFWCSEVKCDVQKNFNQQFEIQPAHV